MYEIQDYEINSEEQNQIIEGFFPQEDVEKKMAIRKINTTLCVVLGIFITITTISYYFAMANEMTLNELSRETTAFNDDNSELENKLDKLKSFNNVDLSSKNNSLTKAKQVIEVAAVKATATTSNEETDNKKPFTFAIGY